MNCKVSQRLVLLQLLAKAAAATQSLQQGLAKAWLNIDTTSFTIRDNLNNSSATDVGSGLATFNITNAMNNDDFAFAISRNGSTNTSNNFVIERTGQTTTSISVSTKFMQTNSINMGDAGAVCATLFGDLA